jgi:malate permease and related proteins
MQFNTVFMSAVSLLFISVLGFILGKSQRLDLTTIAKLLIYLLSPATMFITVYQSPPGWHYLCYTILFYLLGCFMATVGLLVGKRLWRDNTANLLAYASGTANAGFFGLPMALVLFASDGVAVVVFSLLGLTLYEFTYGFYLTARGNFSIRESWHKLTRLPLLYALALAIWLKEWGVQLPASMLSVLVNFKGAYSVCGMLLIGLSLSAIVKWQLDYRFLTSALVMKFMAWPLLIVAILLLHLLPADWVTGDVAGALLLLSIVPVAGSCVMMSVELNVKPEKAATAVMLSTLLAIVIIPVYLGLVLPAVAT